MTETTLDNLIKALKRLRDDKRNFELEYPVNLSNKHIVIMSDGFLYKKIMWFLGLKDEPQKPGKSQEGNAWVYKGTYNDGGLLRWYRFINLLDGAPIEITLKPQNSTLKMEADQ